CVVHPTPLVTQAVVVVVGGAVVVAGGSVVVVGGWVVVVGGSQVLPNMQSPPQQMLPSPQGSPSSRGAQIPKPVQAMQRSSQLPSVDKQSPSSEQKTHWRSRP